MDHYIEDIDRGITELTMKENTMKSHGEAEELGKKIEALKKRKESAEKNLRFQESDERRNLNPAEQNEGSDLMAAIGGFKKEEDCSKKQSRASGSGEFKTGKGDMKMKKEQTLDHFQDPNPGGYSSIHELIENMQKLTDGYKGMNETQILHDQSDNLDLEIYANIEGLEEETMTGLNPETEEKCSSDPPNIEKRIREWLEWSDESGADWETYKKLKNRAFQLATSLSHLLLHFTFSLSESEEAVKKFRFLASLLKGLTEDENCMVIGVFVAQLEMAYQELSQMTTESLKGAVVAGSIGPIIDERILQFLQEILHLEQILNHQAVSGSELVRQRAISTVAAGVQECEKELKKIEVDITQTKVTSKWILDSEGLVGYLHMKETRLKEMESKIKELWNQAAKSDEDKDHPQD